MKLTFLGTGTSTGVPAIGCGCETCVSEDRRDKRLRVSIVVEHAGQTVLVDASTDFRQQALQYGLRHVDALLITHCHADHIFGLDDIRPLNFRHGALAAYANERAWQDIRRIFEYIFEPTHYGGGLPQVVAHTAAAGAAFCLAKDFEITPLEVLHGKLPVLAYRFNDFAYVTDLSEIPSSSLEALRGLDVLALDCLRFKEHPTHLNLERALHYIDELKPRRTFLTHLAHDFKHERDSPHLPTGVYFAYDGLEVRKDEG